MKKKSLVIKIIIVVILIFLVVYHGIWYYCYSTYKTFMDAVGKDEYGHYLYIDEGKKNYYVAPPKYPFEFYGNLAISDFRSSDLKSGDVLVDMIIWPSVNGTYKVGFMLQIVEELELDENIAGKSYIISTKNVSFELDEQKNFLHEYNEEEKKLFEENRQKVDAYYEKAYQMWGILGDS